MTDLPRLTDALPTLAAALSDSLMREAEAALAAQVYDLQVHATCACDEDGCLTVYVAPMRGEPCRDAYRVVTPDAVMTVGVCEEQMESIEDNALLNARSDTSAREAEYRALVGSVPSRQPTDL